jgi:repressor LexA
MARHFGIAQNAVNQLIRYLRQKGYLARTETHRGLRLSPAYLRHRQRTEGMPVVGRVAAGTPLLAVENIEQYVDFRNLFGGSENRFILRVAGDSMVDEGIMPGDYVVVEPGSRIENGQIGVVLLDDEATVKRVFIQRDRIALKPANRAAGYKTRYISRSAQTLRIIGRVIGCFRKM